MTAPRKNDPAPICAAFFCAQARAPDEEYLNGLHSFLSQHQHGQSLLREVSNLKHYRIWSTFAAASNEVASLDPGPEYVDILNNWAAKGVSGPLSAERSGAVALPLLVILQIGQYLRYLDHHKLTHQAFLANVREAGGLQGLCGGLATAIAISCATDEAHLIQHTATALRIVMAVGAFSEAADDTRGTGSTTLALRLKYEGQGEELTQHFPGTYVSVVTEPRSISIVGPAGTLDKLFLFAREQERLQVLKMDIRGKVHNPENKDVAAALCKLCDATPGLQLPDASELQAPVRSNRSGQRLVEGSLTKELVTAILEYRCEWYTVLVETAKDLKAACIDAPNMVYFGLTDTISLGAFHRNGLRPAKTAASSLIPRMPRTSPVEDAPDFSECSNAGTKTDRSGQDRDVPKRLNGNSYSYPENAVAVIGASARLPGAQNIHELWELLSKGEDRHEKLGSDRFDLYNSFRVSQDGGATKNRNFYGNFIDGVKKFDHAFFGINAREMLNMDPQQRLLLELAYEAMECSGYTRTHVRSRGDPIGCFIGASLVEYLDNTNAHPATAYTSTGTIRAFLCGRLSYYFGWSGPAEVIDTACSSSLVAINRAVKAIQAGECSTALTGGVNLITGANNFLDLGKAGFLSPTGQCKPFDKDADGYCRAEGGGLIVLKSLKQAELDGDHIMGVIVGAATNQGGLSESLTLPSSDAQIMLYRSVLEQADMSPQQVTYVEAHGTGTRAGDPLEIASIRSVFGGNTRTTELQIGSIKGNIGHCETAAGVAGVLKIICMLQHQAFPPQASHKVWNPKIPALSPDRMAISSNLGKWEAPIRAALVNSYGAAGSNAAIICCEAPEPQTQPLQPESHMQFSPNWPVILSAKSTTSLKRYKDALVDYLTKMTPQPPISSIARTLSERRQRHKHFVVFEASNTAELLRHLVPDGVRGPVLEQGAPKSVVLTFGGQSKQTVGLNKGFYEDFPTFRATLNLCNNILQELGCVSILPAVFDTTTNISDIIVLQTGFVAVQYAMATTWMSAGLKVAAVVGQSLGELTALAVSGTLSIRDCLKLVAARANLMKTKWGPDNGAMLAIFSSRDVVVDSLVGTGLEIACYNSDSSQVVTGESRSIADLEQRLSSQSPPMKVLRVDTSHGFHSRLVDPILSRLDQVAASIKWNEPTIPIEFCTEVLKDPGSPYSPSEHARRPVFLAEAVRRLEQNLGTCVFLEAGTNTPIISMIKRAVARPESHNFIALSAKDAEGSSNIISRTVCALWRSSVEVAHWSLAEPNCSINYVWLPPYQFDPTTGWLDNVDRAALFQSQLKEAAVPEENQARSPAAKLRMVTLLPNLENSGKASQHFRVLVTGHRFRTIVASHAVRDRPLCPATVYLECITMALSIVAGDLQNSFLDFQGLDIQAPLGLGAEVVEVVLEEVSAQSCWGFKVISRGRKETLHARGRVTRSSESKLETIARLVGKRADSLAANADAERILSRRVYSLFSRVVTYGTVLHGISSVTMSDTEAIADIVIPSGQPGVEESTAVQTCDAVTLDSFIQVVGLLINTSDMVGNNEVMVCTGIDSSMVAKNVNMIDCRSWKVHASYTASSPTQAIGDVIGFAEDGSLAAALTGCRFAKLDIGRLERLLDPANEVTGAEVTQLPLQHQPVVVPSTVKPDVGLSKTSDYGSGPYSDGKPLPSRFSKTIRQTLETYTGLAAASIPDDAIFGDLGLDSLAATEISEELRSVHQINIDGLDLLNSSIKQLEKRVYGSSPEKVVPALKARVSADGIKGSLITSHSNGDAYIDKVSSTSGGPKLLELLAEVTGIAISAIDPRTTLELLGVDSLALTEIKSSLAEVAPNENDITLQSTVKEILQTLEVAGDDSSRDSEATSSADSKEMSSSTTSVAQSQTSFSLPRPKIQGDEIRIKTAPALGLLSCEAKFERAAASRGFQNYWSEVVVKQDALTLAYIVEAFQKVGVNFASLKEGEKIPPIRYLPKHGNAFRRLLEILGKHGIIASGDDNSMVRTNKTAPTTLSSQLHEEFIRQYPDYAIEARLMALTGPKLAECLVGEADPLRILFGSPSASKILEDVYGLSPMFATATRQLVTLIKASLPDNGDLNTTLRILEVGAGTGGTTAELAAHLADLGVRVEYMFTDVSSTMVTKAKTKFARYNSWMSFERLDLEKPAPEHLHGKFDIAIGTMCVHATRSKVATTGRIRTMLNSDGFMVLSEVTRTMDWYEIVFGLLEGWWLADGGSSYPLQPPETWMSIFRDAGFASTMYSQGSSEDANTQRLLIGSNRVDNTP